MNVKVEPGVFGRHKAGGSGLRKAFYLLRRMAAARILKVSAIAGTLVLLRGQDLGILAVKHYKVST